MPNATRLWRRHRAHAVRNAPTGHRPEAQGWRNAPTLGRRLVFSSTPAGLWPGHRAPHDLPQPRWGCFQFATVTQGSSCLPAPHPSRQAGLATLGNWRSQPRWGWEWRRGVSEWRQKRTRFGMPQRGIGPKPKVGVTRLSWEGGCFFHQPQRGCGMDTVRRTIWRNPVGVVFNLRPLPRVARSSQPWAGGRSPVGAGNGGAA